MKIITTNTIKKFQAYLENEEKSAATLEKYLRDVTAFLVWTAEKSINKTTVLAYKKYLLENYASASVNSVLSSLNSFFDFNEWYELKVKSLKIQKTVFAKPEKELTKAEYERLLKAAKSKGNERLNLVMQTLCSCGIRVSELCCITAESVKKGQAEIKCKGKIRYVFMPKALCRILEKYIKKYNIKSGSVFITKKGNPLNRSNIWSDMKKLCEEADVSKEKVFPHNLRHLFARTFYSVNKDIVRLADILGHSSINTTRIYTKESGEIHKKIIQRLGLVPLLC